MYTNAADTRHQWHSTRMSVLGWQDPHQAVTVPAKVYLKATEALCSEPAPARRTWGGEVEAGLAAHHYPAGDDAGGNPRDHAPPPRRRPHGRPHSVHDRLCSFCVDLRMMLRIEHRLVSGASGFSSVSSPLAQPSRLCISAHPSSSPSTHSTPLTRDGTRIGARWHRSCAYVP